MRERAPTPLAWDVAYEGTPTWDIGRPQPVVLRLLAEGSLAGRVLDAGCGSGEHARAIAAAGTPVAGVDVSWRAIERARARVAAAGLDVPFAVADALELDGTLVSALGGPFDVALDVGLFHVLQPDDRRRYAASLARAVRPGGRAFVACWSSRNPFGYGPERVTRSMLRRSFVAATGWRVDAIEPVFLDTRLPEGRVHAWLARLHRR